jgi:single-strand DNA-binding protein
MSGINKVILVGHLGKDPEVKSIDNGVKVAKFSLATTESYRDKNGERKDVTEWHNITCWRNLAEIAEKYLTKGKQIYVEGKIRTRSWEDNGVKKYAVDIVADSFTMLGTKSENTESSTKQVNDSHQNEPVVSNTELPPFMAEEEDLPF